MKKMAKKFLNEHFKIALKLDVDVYMLTQPKK